VVIKGVYEMKQYALYFSDTNVMVQSVNVGGKEICYNSFDTVDEAEKYHLEVLDYHPDYEINPVPPGIHCYRANEGVISS